MPRVLCAGHVNWDVTLRVDRLPSADAESTVRAAQQTGGGSAANVAVALVGLECEAAIVGSVGDDEYGPLVRRDLAEAGVDLSGLQTADGDTTTKYLLVDEDGEVAVLGAEGVNEAVKPGDVDPDLVAAADHVHLTAQWPATALRIAELASDAGVPVSVDPGRRFGDRDFDPVVARADLAFVNRVEAEALGERPADLDVVTTFGRDGSRLETPDATYAHPGFDLAAVDTSGAGDAFAAGFIAARLRGEGPDSALAVGNACGALAAATAGPVCDLAWDRVAAVLDGERPGF